MHVLLLGAEFSCYVGLPTMAQFGDVFHDRLRRVSNAGAERLRSAGDTFKQFHDYCRNSRSFIQVDTNNLEVLFCAAEAMREANIQTVMLANGPANINDIIRDLALWTWNIYQGLPDFFDRSNRGAVSDHYRQFMDWLKPLRRNTTVLTTNYDVLFETVAYKAGISVRHPFNAERLFVKHDDVRFLSAIDDSISLCKLHGSVSYFDSCHGNTSTRVCSEIARQVKTEVYGKSNYVHDYRPHPAVICLGTLAELEVKYGSLTPAIIAPTYAKLQSTNWLQQTWHAAVDALRKAKVLTIIGYSFPASDGFMRAMFLAAMADRDTTEPLHVLFVSPDKEAAGRVSELFRPLVEQSRFVWRARRFEDWSADCDTDLKSWLAESA